MLLKRVKWSLLGLAAGLHLSCSGDAPDTHVDRQVVALAYELASEDWRKAEDSFHALKVAGPALVDALPVLRELLHHKSPPTRYRAAELLGRFGAASVSAVPRLCEMLVHDEYEFARCGAASALGGIGPLAKAAVPMLVDALLDSDAHVASAAAIALGRIGPDAALATHALVSYFMTTDDDFALQALGRIGPGAISSCPVLLGILSDTSRSDDQQEGAAWALRHIGGAGASVREELERAADRGIVNAQEALDALDLQSEGAPRSLRGVAPTGDEDADVIQHAIEARVEASMAKGDRFAAEWYLGAIESTVAKDARLPALRSRTRAIPWPKESSIDLGGGVQMEFVLIPAGVFQMGSVSGDEDEMPVAQVTISRAFYLAKCEVTQEQWMAVMGTDPSRFKGATLPVHKISWESCQAFIQALNRGGSGPFALPTEAQWEYACRAGTTTEYWSGDSEEGLARVGWYRGNSAGRPHAVGEKPANPWGPYDMHGNVWEWCQDTWHHSYEGAPVDGSAWVDGGSGDRVSRGGSWDSAPGLARSAFRRRLDPSDRFNDLGVRPARLVTSD